MTDDSGLLKELSDGRAQFLALVKDLRPELHRYCARMTGSVADGEDVVQEALARAYYALSELEELPALRPWLFRIAHRRALDHLRRYDVRMGQSLDAVTETMAGEGADPEDAFGEREATRAAISRFLGLVPVQRSSVILKDVLGHSLEEIAALLDTTVPAVKAALHRGRERLEQSRARPPAELVGPPTETLARYVALFNAYDWDGVRAMLAEDVRLDLVSRSQRAGREVSRYFTNYDRLRGFRLVPARVDGKEVIAVFRQGADAKPSYFVELVLEAGRVVNIRDYRYVDYILNDAELVLTP